MATLGMLASWAAALFGGWALLGGLAAAAPGHPVRRSAERALVASALAAFVASTALLNLLLSADVTVSYVARSVTTNLSAPFRLGALWNLPAGAVLPTAGLVALAGTLAVRHARSSLGTAVLGALVLALGAASLAATPFATLPWVPTEGLGLSPRLQHPLSIVGEVALSFAVAAGAALVAALADRLADDPRGAGAGEVAGEGLRSWGGAVALLSLAMWCGARGSYATGVGSTPLPLAAWDGSLVPALVALVLARQARVGGALTAFVAALGALGLLCAVVLGATPRSSPGWAVSAFSVVSLGAAAVGAAVATGTDRAFGDERTLMVRTLSTIGVAALTGAAAAMLWRPASSTWAPPVAQWLLVGGGMLLVAAGHASAHAQRSSRRWVVPAVALATGAVGLAVASATPLVAGWSLLAGGAGALALVHLVADRGSRGYLPDGLAVLAVAIAAVGAAGEVAGVTVSVQLAGGETVRAVAPVGHPFVLAHQGISRFEDDNAHVEALALEPSREGRQLPLLSADRREFVDSRDELLGPALARPAILTAGVEQLRVRLTAVDADERVQLQLTIVPFAVAWLAAVVAVVVAAVLLLALPVTPARPSSTPAVTALA